MTSPMPSAPTYRHAHWYFLAGLAAILAGFWPSFFHPMGTGEIWHTLHGITATLWVVALITQSWLMSRGLVWWHRRVAIGALALVPVMVYTAFYMVRVMQRNPEMPPFLPPLLGFIDIPSLLFFLALVTLALLARRTPAAHKRFMSATILLAFPPALTRLFARLFGEQIGFMGALHASFVVVEVILVALIFADRRVNETAARLSPFAGVLRPRPRPDGAGVTVGAMAGVHGVDREVAGGMMELLASLGVLLSGVYLVALGVAALVVPGRVTEFFANFATSARAHYLEMFTPDGGRGGDHPDRPPDVGLHSLPLVRLAPRRDDAGPPRPPLAAASPLRRPGAAEGDRRDAPGRRDRARRWPLHPVCVVGGDTLMLGRSILAWCAILVLAVINGALRQGFLIPRLGEGAGHIVSTLLLSALVLGATWLLLPWIGATTRGDAWSVGGLWLLLTVAFEFLAGHYLFGTPWEELLADYNVTQGRIWVLVLVTTLLAPALVLHLRQPRSRPDRYGREHRGTPLRARAILPSGPAPDGCSPSSSRRWR